jgi:hypothetical protein
MYIDPSTGGLLFQVLAIAFTAISGVVLVFSNRIKMFFKRLGKKGDAAEESNEETVEEKTEDTVE